MKRSLILSLVLSFLAPAVASAALPAEIWYELLPEDRIVLNQDITLKGLRGEEIRIAQNENFILDEVIALSEISVMQYLLTQKNCENADLESEMEIILPNENPPSAKSEVGVVYHSGCRLEIYVEAKDSFQPSLFRK